MILHPRQRGRLATVARGSATDRDAKRFGEHPGRALVAGGNGCEEIWRARGERRNQRSLAAGFERHVEQQRRDSGKARRGIGAYRLDRERDDHRAIGQLRLRQFLLEPHEHRPQFRAGCAEPRELGGGYIGQAQLFEGARQRTRETRLIENRREVRKLCRWPQMKHRTRRDRARCQCGSGRKAERGHLLRGQQPGKAIESQAMNPRERSTFDRERADQIVGARPRGCDHDRLGARLERTQPFARSRNPFGSASRGDYLSRIRHRKRHAGRLPIVRRKRIREQEGAPAVSTTTVSGCHRSQGTANPYFNR